MMNTWFRNPIEQAVVLLDTLGELEAAQNMARMNALYADDVDDKECMYWSKVLKALLPEVAAEC